MDKKLLSYKIALCLLAIFGLGSYVLAYYGSQPREGMPPVPSSEEITAVTPPPEIAPIELAAELAGEPVPPVENPNEETLGVTAPLSGEAIDLVGSRSGTSTPTGVGWYGNFAATTSYPIRIESGADAISFTVNPVSASSSAGAYFSVLQSNDRGCDTATTSPDVGNPILVKDIIWYDAGQHVLELAGSQTIGNGTSTIAFNPLSHWMNKSITLTNLNTKCLRLDVNASSTVLWIQAKIKKLFGF